MKPLRTMAASGERLKRQQEAFTSEGSPAPGRVQANHPAQQVEDRSEPEPSPLLSRAIEQQPAADCSQAWGEQTEAALRHFPVTGERMPWRLIEALVQVKRAAARVNASLGMLDAPEADAIVRAADEVLAGEHAMAFPLSLWQSGSATQTHMNVNEVLARRASALLLTATGKSQSVHANDHVNLGQSSNDVVPTAMHIATLCACRDDLLPALEGLRTSLGTYRLTFGSIVKTGRTHLRDAVPLTLAQEVSGWEAQLEKARAGLVMALESVHELAIGGTAVGTGLNTHPAFADRMVSALADLTGLPLRRAGNAFAAQAAHDALVQAHGALRTLAVALTKIANDVRWLASGPRCGLAELILPANEPGSSMMPGKANPTQCEALLMVAAQVMGNDVAVGIGGAAGHFELNTAKPLLVHNVLQSIRLLASGMRGFDRYCVQGMTPNRPLIAAQLSQSLMLVTALVPHIGYEQAAAIALQAQSQGSSLRDAAIASGFVTRDQFDAWVSPERMV